MRKPIRQRIEELEQQKRTLQLRLDRQEKAQERRRTMLLGAFLMEQLQLDDEADQDGEQVRGQDIKDWVARALPSFVRRDADRALFADLLTADNAARKQASLIAPGGDTYDIEDCDNSDDDNEGVGPGAHNGRRGDRDGSDYNENVDHGDDRP